MELWLLGLFCPKVSGCGACMDGKSRNAGSLHLPGWAGAEQRWGPLVLPVGWKCSLAWGKGKGAPGVTGFCTVPSFCVFITLFSWVSSAPLCHKEVW